jgi:hypothetical protein
MATWAWKPVVIRRECGVVDESDTWCFKVMDLGKDRFFTRLTRLSASGCFLANYGEERVSAVDLHRCPPARVYTVNYWFGFENTPGVDLDNHFGLPHQALLQKHPEVADLYVTVHNELRALVRTRLRDAVVTCFPLLSVPLWSMIVAFVL